MADWNALRNALAQVDDFITYLWDDLDDLVGGLPPSAYVHSAFWKGKRSGWPGFSTTNVNVGNQVTFVRVGSTLPAGQTPKQVHVTNRTPLNLQADLVLIACVKQKLDHSAPARDLYTSDLFRKEREFAERSGVPWFILSAEHGLVGPDEVLEPYDLHLAKASAAYRDAWGGRVVDQLEAVASPLLGKVIEIHAGAAYLDPLRDRMIAKGALVQEPLKGLKFGPRLAWYRQRLKVVDALNDDRHALGPTDFLNSKGEGFRAPGLYSWWVDGAGAAELSVGLGHQVTAGLLYAGLAGATRSRSGRKSKNTLWGRISGMHLGGRHEFSTFRLSLGSILASARDEPEINETNLTAWMHQHLRVVAIPFGDADQLSELESDVLLALDPPLNLDKVPKNPFRLRLSELRRTYDRTTPRRS